jgi:hypothetical protein
MGAQFEAHRQAKLVDADNDDFNKSCDEVWMDTVGPREVAEKAPNQARYLKRP